MAFETQLSASQLQSIVDGVSITQNTPSTKQEPDKTKKLADSPTKRADEVQPWNLFGWVDRLGGQEIRHTDPKNPKAFFLEKMHPNGSTETHEASTTENAHTNELHAGHHRQYVAKGKHDHADGNHASSTSQNRHIDTKKDTGLASGSNIYNGAGQKIIGGSGQGSFHNNTGGETFHTSSGDVVHSHDGNYHQEYVGDNIRAIVGNSIEMVGTGDHGIHVQLGNFDLTATVGKGKVKSGQLLTLESPTSILVNCGVPGGAAGATLFMTPASAKMSVGPVGGGSSLTMTPANITAKVGATTITVTAGSITLTSGTSTIAITPALIEILAAAGVGPIKLNK